MKKKTPEFVPKEFRLLRIGEIIREGDLMLTKNASNWIEIAAGSVGLKVEETDGNHHFRRVKP